MSGVYCIYRKGGSCPPGFSSGWIKWDDEDSGNINDLGGTVPDGVYDHDTLIYYCCRGDDDKANLMSLPSDRDFFLLAYQSRVCQKVKWFIESTEWLHFDTHSVGHSNSQGGSHPFLEDWSDRKIYYCFYKRELHAFDQSKYHSISRNWSYCRDMMTYQISKECWYLCQY